MCPGREKEKMKMEVGCLVALVALVISPALYVLNGWALSILWEWFIVPIGLPPVSVPMAVGIAIVVGFLTKQTETKHCVDTRTKDEKITDAIASIVAMIAYPLVALGIGWIVRGFIGG
jgi:hypothetical protein